MKQLSIRNVTSDLAAALERERRATGATLNETVLRLLRRALGLGSDPYDNGLGTLAGTWSDTDLEQFQSTTAAFGELDEELWR